MATIIHTTYDDLDNKTLVANTEGEISVQTDASIGRTVEGALTVNAYSIGDSDARFLHKTGDTATGSIYVTNATPTSDTGFYLAPSTGNGAYPQFKSFISQDKNYYLRVLRGASDYTDVITWMKDTNAFTSAIFPLKSEVYNKTESDSRFLNTGEAYTKAESDARYEPIDSAYTKAEADGRFANTTGDTFTGHLTGTTAGFSGNISAPNFIGVASQAKWS